MVRVKICGVTRPEDVRLIVREGADAIGFQMSQGPRKITPQQARRLVKLVPPFVTPVGVFVNEPLSRVKALIKYCGFQAVQLHGEENEGFCGAIPVPVLKAIRMKSKLTPRAYRGFHIAAFLLDHYNKDIRGGTGGRFDWKWARKSLSQLPAPVLLAGGLTPDNVARAIQTARPFGVDVASGVEILPGRKDPLKVSQFIRRAKKAVQA
jgi:phosphoribosylanthranilate isomerase